MVHLQKFQERYSKDDLQVFVVSMHADPKQAQQLTKELGVKYPVFNGDGSDLGKNYAFG